MYIAVAYLTMLVDRVLEELPTIFFSEIFLQVAILNYQCCSLQDIAIAIHLFYTYIMGS